MSEDYLWNREGRADEEVVRLEKLLGALGYAARLRPVQRHKLRHWWPAAAALLVGLGVIPLIWHRAPLTDWQLTDGQRLRAGQVLDTGGAKSVAIESQSTGRVEIDPHSSLRLIESAEKEQKFDLTRGTIHALIWAPPGRFVVNTPSARTVDLGCRYTLQVAEDGTGLLSVETGWVAFEWQKRESFIPAGAECVTKPRRGPGTPWFADAPAALKTALTAFDETSGSSSLTTALQAARERDALSVWHLLVRTQVEQRGKVFDTFARLVRLPENVTREAVLRGDPQALDAAWDALNLGSTDWWREWKRKW